MGLPLATGPRVTSRTDYGTGPRAQGDRRQSDYDRGVQGRRSGQRPAFPGWLQLAGLAKESSPGGDQAIAYAGGEPCFSSACRTDHEWFHRCRVDLDDGYWHWANGEQ